jgi:hypothetical protein
VFLDAVSDGRLAGEMVRRYERRAHARIMRPLDRRGNGANR